ncbi:MAG: hypothetical protein H6509_10700 [Bryobacterales bacterium]|nr:hypothetical protein [Bryobacterales bacterium]
MHFLLRADSAEGAPLLRLGKDDLQVTIDSEPAAVADLEDPSSPIIIVVVLDLVDDLNRIDAARSKLAEMASAMGKGQYLALMRAQDGLQVILDPTVNRRQFVEKLEAAPVTGFPGLLDTVEQADAVASAIMQRTKVRVAVLYLTDGQISDYRGDYSSAVVNPSDSGDLSRRFRDRLVQERIASIASNLGRYPAPLFFIHLQERTNSLDVAYQNGIRQFAAVTGGSAYFSRGLADVPQLVDTTVRQILSSYALTVTPASEAYGQRRIAVSGPEGASLTYRETFESVKSKD